MELSPDHDKFIETILGNPENLAPPASYSPVRGILKQLISCAVTYYTENNLLNPTRPHDAIQLTAANNKVKKMYNHYGFDIFPYDNSRPEDVIRRAPGAKRQGKLTKWHTHNHMYLSVTAAEQLQSELIGDRPPSQADGLAARTAELAVHGLERDHSQTSRSTHTVESAPTQEHKQTFKLQ